MKTHRLRISMKYELSICIISLVVCCFQSLIALEEVPELKVAVKKDSGSVGSVILGTVGAGVQVAGKGIEAGTNLLLSPFRLIANAAGLRGTEDEKAFVDVSKVEAQTESPHSITLSVYVIDGLNKISQQKMVGDKETGLISVSDILQWHEDDLVLLWNEELELPPENYPLTLTANKYVYAHPNRMNHDSLLFMLNFDKLRAQGISGIEWRIKRFPTTKSGGTGGWRPAYQRIDYFNVYYLNERKTYWEIEVKGKGLSGVLRWRFSTKRKV